VQPANSDAGDLSFLRELVTGHEITDDVEDPEYDDDSADNGGDEAPVHVLEDGSLPWGWLIR
jgi:hypothetical protein